LSFETHALAIATKVHLCGKLEEAMSGRKPKAPTSQMEDRPGDGPSLPNDEVAGYVNSSGVASGMLPPSSNDKSRLPKASAQGMKIIGSSATDQRRPSTYGMFNALYEDSDGSDGR
jgi:hypothetical protein